MATLRNTEAEINTAFRALQDIVTAAIQNARQQGRDEALASIRQLVGGGVGNGEPVKRGPGRPKGSKNRVIADGAAPTGGKKRKNSWAGLSVEARLARVNAIRKGKGLPPKSA